MQRGSETGEQLAGGNFRDGEWADGWVDGEQNTGRSSPGLLRLMNMIFSRVVTILIFCSQQHLMARKVSYGTLKTSKYLVSCGISYVGYLFHLFLLSIVKCLVRTHLGKQFMHQANDIMAHKSYVTINVLGPDPMGHNTSSICVPPTLVVINLLKACFLAPGEECSYWGSTNQLQAVLFSSKSLRSKGEGQDWVGEREDLAQPGVGLWWSPPPDSQLLHQAGQPDTGLLKSPLAKQGLL